MVQQFTPRGFAIYKEIKTSYGGVIRVQESSNVIPSIWLFVEESTGCESYDQHLNVPQAIQLWEAVGEFLREQGAIQ